VKPWKSSCVTVAVATLWCNFDLLNRGLKPYIVHLHFTEPPHFFAYTHLQPPLFYSRMAPLERREESYLANLPDELLHQIISEVPRKDLTNVALISPHFNNLMKPFLYSSIDLELLCSAHKSGDCSYSKVLRLRDDEQKMVNSYADFNQFGHFTPSYCEFTRLLNDLEEDPRLRCVKIAADRCVDMSFHAH